jgi:hypothetical protein
VVEKDPATVLVGEFDQSQRPQSPVNQCLGEAIDRVNDIVRAGVKTLGQEAVERTEIGKWDVAEIAQQHAAKDDLEGGAIDE